MAWRALRQAVPAEAAAGVGGLQAEVWGEEEAEGAACWVDELAGEELWLAPEVEEAEGTGGVDGHQVSAETHVATVVCVWCVQWQQQ